MIAQPLAEDVRVERLEARQLLQPLLEDRHFLVAVHPSILKVGLGVQLADLAGRPLTRASFRDVAEALLEEIEHVLIVERVIDAAALPPPSHDPHRPHQPELVGDGRLAEADAIRDLVDAELAASQRRRRCGRA